MEELLPFFNLKKSMQVLYIKHKVLLKSILKSN